MTCTTILTAPFGPQMTDVHVRVATLADIPRIWEIRLNVTDNQLRDRARVSDAEVEWYVENAITLMALDQHGIAQGFASANPLTGLVWALFVIERQEGRGLGSALLREVEKRLLSAGNRQAFLTTGHGSRAEAFYARHAWQRTGMTRDGEAVYRKPL